MQESLRCKVIVWDEATMSNKLRQSCANEVNACFKASKLWEHFQVMHLSTNMRVHLRTGTLAEKSADVLLKNG